MAKLNLEDYRGKDLYSDGDIENEILQIVKDGGLPEDAEQVRFPILYHLSQIRENILNWYPFKKGASCLEIGSGCGAITGLLCERLERVVSVELSRRRAQINYERHKDLPNLEIRVGNQNDMTFEGGFDYVVLNGVFEYAMSFTQGERPYEAFLQKIRSFLKPDGVILVAIENRLGLKYFAGAPEDHTDGYFDGIRGYEDNHSVRTFSRGEWETLMKQCGLPFYRFYYPYPDYKFPNEIFTDESLREHRYGSPSWNFTKYRMALFREAQMAETLQKEGVMAHFANSFLIEMSAEPLEEEHVLYAKLGTDRAEEFRIATVIIKTEETNQEETAEGTGQKRAVPDEKGRGMAGRMVLKRPMTQKAAAHIRRMWESCGILCPPGGGQEESAEGSADRQAFDGGQEESAESGAVWHPLGGKMTEDGIVYPYLTGESLGQQADRALQTGDYRKLEELLRRAAEAAGMKQGSAGQAGADAKKIANAGQAGADAKKTANAGQAGADAKKTANAGQVGSGMRAEFSRKETCCAGQTTAAADMKPCGAARQDIQVEHQEKKKGIFRCKKGASLTGEEWAAFAEVFGDGEIRPEEDCVAPANIDLILDNLFEDQDGLCAIDCEWIFSFPVPAAFIFWRAVNELYSSHPCLDQEYPRRTLLEAYGISEQKERLYEGWAVYFAGHYVKANRLLKKSVPEIGISIEEFRRRRRAQEVLVSQLYVDTGNGFTEQQKLVQETPLTDGRFALTFDLSEFEGIRALRFDPLEGRPCVCRMDERATNVTLTAANAAVSTKQSDFFLTTDPVYQIREVPEGRVRICGAVRVLSEEEALRRAQTLLGKRRRFPAFWRKR